MLVLVHDFFWKLNERRIYFLKLQILYKPSIKFCGCCVIVANFSLITNICLKRWRCSQCDVRFLWCHCTKHSNLHNMIMLVIHYHHYSCVSIFLSISFYILLINNSLRIASNKVIATSSNHLFHLLCILYIWLQSFLYLFQDSPVVL